MNFKKIVAKINYSPNMIWLLSDYDRKNNLEIKKTKWVLILILFTFLWFKSLDSIHKINYKNNSNYNKNISTTSNSLNNFKIKNNKLFLTDYDKNKQLYAILDIKHKDKVKQQKNLKISNKGNWYEISSNNLGKNSKRLNLSGNLFIKQAQKKYYGDVVRINKNSKKYYILNNGNIIINNYNVVKNNTIDLSNYYTAKINSNTVKSTDTGNLIELLISVKKKKNLPKELSEFNILYFDLSDFLEYSKLQNKLNLENSRIRLNLTNKKTLKKKLFLNVLNKSSKKQNVNITNSYNCLLEAKLVDANKKIKINNCNDTNATSFSNKLDSLVSETSLWESIKFFNFAMLIIFAIKLINIMKLLLIREEIKEIRKNINQGIL